jgi:hypothetical protein
MTRAAGLADGIRRPYGQLWALRIETLVGDATCVPPKILQMTRRQAEKCTQLNRTRSNQLAKGI